LAKKTIKAILSDKNFTVGMLTVPVSYGPICILNVFIMSWLQGFYDKLNGPIKDMNTVVSLYQVQGSIGCVIAFISMGLFGKVIDKLSVRITLPATLIFRGIVNYSVTFIKNPTDSYMFYIILPLTHFATYSVIIALKSYV
jgi:hypothetical protein